MSFFSVVVNVLIRMSKSDTLICHHENRNSKIFKAFRSFSIVMMRTSGKAIKSFTNSEKLTGFDLYDLQTRGWKLLWGSSRKFMSPAERKGRDYLQMTGLNKLALIDMLFQL